MFILRLKNIEHSKTRGERQKDETVWQMENYLTLNKCSLHSTNIGVLMTAVDMFPKFLTKSHWNRDSVD